MHIAEKRTTLQVDNTMGYLIDFRSLCLRLMSESRVLRLHVNFNRKIDFV